MWGYRKNLRWRKGSFTIEAAVIVPFCLFIMIHILNMGISFYQESILRTPAKHFSEFEAVSMFYKIQMISDAKEGVAKDGL